ncbi:hypothetical protein PIROE2DRAFT_3497, partial [Piromyces sp. E2]
AYRYLIAAKVLNQLQEFYIQPCYERLCRSLYNCAKNSKQMKLLWKTILEKIGNRLYLINSSYIIKVWKDLCKEEKYQYIFHTEDEILSKIEKTLNKYSQEKKLKKMMQNVKKENDQSKSFSNNQKSEEVIVKNENNIINNIIYSDNNNDIKYENNIANITMSTQNVNNYNYNKNYNQGKINSNNAPPPSNETLIYYSNVNNPCTIKNINDNNNYYTINTNYYPKISETSNCYLKINNNISTTNNINDTNNNNNNNNNNININNNFFNNAVLNKENINYYSVIGTTANHNNNVYSYTNSPPNYSNESFNKGINHYTFETSCKNFTIIISLTNAYQYIIIVVLFIMSIKTK